MKNAYEIKELLDNGGSICIYDTETTGLKKPESRILSFSAIIVRKVDGHLQEEKSMDILMDPECDIPDFRTLLLILIISAMKMLLDVQPRKRCASRLLIFLNLLM